MKTYAAIGHFKGSENITSIAYTANTKKDFINDCYGNEFVPYVILTENMLAKIQNYEGIEIWEQVKKMTTNYRVWNDVTDYLEQCFDIIMDKVNSQRD